MFLGRRYLVISLAIGALSAVSTSVGATTLNQQRAYFKEAVKLVSDPSPRYFQLKRQLSGYPLAPYLDYYEIRRDITSIDQATLRSFIAKHSDMPVANTLIHRRLSYLGKNQRWSEYLSTAKQRPKSSQLACYYYTAQLYTGKRKQAYQGAQDLWLTGRSQSSACDPLFAQWESDGKLTSEMIWQRQLLAAKNNNLPLIKYLDKKSQGAYRFYSNELVSAYSNPARFNHDTGIRVSPTIAADLISTAARRLAYNDPQQARQLWLKYPQSVLAIPHADRAIVDQEIATRLLRKDPNDRWARQQAAKYAQGNSKPAELVLKHYLTNHSWQSLNQFINTMPSDAKREPIWLYWSSRSQEKLGINRQQVASNFQQLSLLRDYYGFLAAEHIHQPMHFQHAPYRTGNKSTDKLKKSAAYRRIQELLAIDYFQTASDEWLYLQRNASSDQQPALAKLALDQGWGNFTIRQAAQQGKFNNMAMRAPLAFESTILRIAKQQNVDPSWAFSIARQESLFNSGIRSPAGAVGLMQLMPATAKELARRHDIPYRSSRDLEKPAINVALGIRYLDQLQNRFDGNRIYATAAYNAGPGRVSQWLRQRPGLEIDVWAEIIPFTETRNYVKKVTTFDKIYDYQLKHNKPFTVYQ